MLEVRVHSSLLSGRIFIPQSGKAIAVNALSMHGLVERSIPLEVFFLETREIAADAMLRWLVLHDTYSVAAVRYIRSTREIVRSWLGAGYIAGASDSIAQYLILLLGRRVCS